MSASEQCGLGPPVDVHLVAELHAEAAVRMDRVDVVLGEDRHRRRRAIDDEQSAAAQRDPDSRRLDASMIGKHCRARGRRPRPELHLGHRDRPDEVVAEVPLAGAVSGDRPRTSSRLRRMAATCSCRCAAQPLTADPHGSTGSSPGVGIVKCAAAGATGCSRHSPLASNVDARCRARRHTRPDDPPQALADLDALAGRGRPH